MMPRAIIILGIVLASASCAAAAWNGSKAFQSCIDAAAGNDPLMTDCAREEFLREDRRLKAAYAARMAVAEGRLKGAIRASQRAWLGYRDATCQAEGAIYDGGTMEPQAQADCEARLTAERVDWLKQLTP